MSVDQVYLEATLLQNLIKRDPVHTSGLHRHRTYPAALQPVGESLQITGETSKPACSVLISIRRHCNVYLLRADVDPRRVRLHQRRSTNSLLFLRGHHRLLVCWRTRPEARILAVSYSRSLRSSAG